MLGAISFARGVIESALHRLGKRGLALATELPSSAADRGHAYSFLYEQQLDKALLQPDVEELDWFKAATGIHDEGALKDHICSVASEAFAVFPYPCIRNFNFTKLKISRLPSYRRALAIPRLQPEAIFLDMGCCFGNDARRIAHDGYPSENILCTDLRPEFWALGRKLFRDDTTFNAPFISGNVFDPFFLETAPVQSPEQAVPLTSVRTLTELRGSVSVIHASAFFHLFDEGHQDKLAHLLGTLLSLRPGSMIFGSHSGAFTSAVRNHPGAFAHSPDSWVMLWERVLGKGQCEVEAKLVALDPRDKGPNAKTTMVTHLLEWTVTRL